MSGVHLRLPFDQKFLFEYPEISSSKWNSIFRNSGKREQLREVYTQVFEIFSPRISISFDIPLRISEILAWSVLISKIKQFRIFWNSSRTFSFHTIFLRFETFGSFQWMEGALAIPNFSSPGLSFPLFSSQNGSHFNGSHLGNLTVFEFSGNFLAQNISLRFAPAGVPIFFRGENKGTPDRRLVRLQLSTFCFRRKAGENFLLNGTVQIFKKK